MKRIEASWHCCTECGFCAGHGILELVEVDAKGSAALFYQNKLELSGEVREKISNTMEQLANAGKLAWCEHEPAEPGAPCAYYFNEQGELEQEDCRHNWQINPNADQTGPEPPMVCTLCGAHDPAPPTI